MKESDSTGSGGIPDELQTNDLVAVDHGGDKDDEIKIVGVLKSNRRKDDKNLWKKFQFQDHSLVLYASNVSSCTGYNPFVSCPELMMQHVYQGRGGMALLRHDMKLLGLEYDMKTEEEELMEIAEQAGGETAKKVRQVLEVKHGERELESIEKAQQLRREVAQEAKKSKKLSKSQLKLLEEGTRYSIDTGCGHSWEDYALDQYEKQCGWEVRERNAECRHWKFRKINVGKPKAVTVGICADIDQIPEESRNKKRQRQEAFVPSLEPVEPASVRYRSNQRQVDAESNQKEGSGSDTNDDITNEKLPCNKHTLVEPPYVVIRGMVDGIREELAPRLSRGTDGKDDDDDSWVIRRVIVECKHRMRSILPVPRFHEVIQAVVYCLMYEVEEVDIVQVLRTGRKTADKTYQRPVDSSHIQNIDMGGEDQADGEISTPTKILDRKREETSAPTKLVAEDTQTSKASEAAYSTQTINQDDDVVAHQSLPSVPSKPLKTNIELFTSRISLNDSNIDHVSNWNNIVLPNLRQWIDAVYRIRRSDEKRYLLLNSMAVASSQIFDDGDDDDSIPSTVQDSLRTAWDLVCKECPFLAYGPSGEKMRKDTQPFKHVCNE